MDRLICAICHHNVLDTGMKEECTCICHPAAFHGWAKRGEYEDEEYKRRLVDAGLRYYAGH